MNVKSANKLYMIPKMVHELQLTHAIFLIQRPGVITQAYVTLKNVLELHQLLLKLKAAMTSAKLVTLVNAEPQRAQLETWAHADPKKMEKALLAFATLLTAHAKNAKEVTQTRMANPFTTTVLDCTITA